MHNLFMHNQINRKGFTLFHHKIINIKGEIYTDMGLNITKHMHVLKYYIIPD